MTAINRLTTSPVLSDLDFIPIWDVAAGRTRNIQALSIKTFIADMIPDNDPVIGGAIDNGNLSLKTKSGQTIDIGSVSGVKVENDFITQIYVDSGIQVLIEDGAATISQNITKSIWPIQTITIGESPLSIDSPDQYGIDYEFSYNQSTVMSPSVLLFNAQEGAQIKVSTIGMAKESRPVTVSQLTSGEQEIFWYVTTPTVFMFHEDRWRVEESSQLTHVDGNTTFDSPATKTPVIGISAKPGSSITTEVEDGVLLIGGGVGQDIDIDDYLPLSGGKIDGELEIEPQVPGNPLTVKNLDGGNLLSAYVGDDNFNIEYYKSIADYETSSPSFDLINKAYANEYLAKLNSNNSFTGLQKIVNNELKVEKANGENLFRVNPVNETIVVKGTVNVSGGDGVKSTVFDSGQQSNMLLKWNAQTRVYVGQYDVTFSKKLIASDGVEVTGGSVELPNYTEFKTKDLVTKEYTDNAIQTAIDDIGGNSVYDGEGFGVPGRTETGHGTIIQTVITGNYRNTSNETGDLTINLRTDEGVTNFRLYYSMPHGTLSARKVYVKVDEKAGLNKTIRAGEIWLCQVKAGRFFDDFFWSKVTDGESTFEAIDVSGFDVDQPEIKPLLKRFESTDLIEIPLVLPDGFSVIVRQIMVKRSSGVELEMGFTYKYDGSNLRVHLNEVGTGILIAGIIKDEI